MILRTLLALSISIIANAGDMVDSLGKVRQENAQKQTEQEMGQNLNTLQSLTAFAKNSLIANTNLAKEGFVSPDDVSGQETVDTSIEEKYKTNLYQDMFFSVSESALINQAIDYYKEGKSMIVKVKTPEIKDAPQEKKVEVVRKPLVKLSSIIYTDSNRWAIFTSSGKFTNKEDKRGTIEIVGISKDEAEFEISLPNLNKGEGKPNERVTIGEKSVIVVLRTGECIFEEELQVTKQCSVITEMVDKKNEPTQGD